MTNMSCVELRNIFLEKRKKIPYNHLEDYDYCKLLYENARKKKSSQKRVQEGRREDNRFEDIQMFLREMESEGVFEEVETESDYYEYYQLSSWEEATEVKTFAKTQANVSFSF